MKRIELKDMDNVLNVKQDWEILQFLLCNYPNESAEALGDFVEMEKELNLLSDDKLVYFFELYDCELLIDWIDEYIDDEILVNYYVKDSCGTDRGVWEMVVESAYLLI